METITIVTHTLAFAIGCYYAKNQDFTLIKKLWKGTPKKEVEKKPTMRSQITWENITDVRQLEKGEYVITYGGEYTFRKIGCVYHLINGSSIHHSIWDAIDKHAGRIAEWKELPPQVERILPFNMVKN